MFYTNKFVSDFPAGHKATPKGKNKNYYSGIKNHEYHCQSKNCLYLCTLIIKIIY